MSKITKELEKVDVGATFEVGGVELIKFPGGSDGQTIAVAKDIVFRSTFGNNNNFAKSDILKTLTDKFLPKITDAVGEDNICEIETDLTTLDGLKTYGTIKSKVSLPTFDFYRANVEIFDKYNPGTWWWLATPDSTAPHYGDNPWILCVAPSGDIGRNNYISNSGVRPYWWNVRQSRQQPKSEHPHQKNAQPFFKKDKQKGLCCMTDFEKVIDFGNMYRAYRKSQCGKGFKKSSAKFNVMALDGINALIEQLKSKTYKISAYNKFKVYEPKERVIKTTSFKDKVVQHSLCDNVILPRLEKIFINDNCAGQKGKGTLFGLNRLSEQMKAFHKRYGFNGYILKCDISKFFYSISHQQLKDMVEYYFSDKDICWLCNLFIDSTEGKGIPLGNQINQGLALLYLDSMDKVIKYELGIEYYGRYMDDFYLIHPSKEYLKYCLEVISVYLDTLELSLNGKTQIFPFKNGVNYLGFHTYITRNGKIIRKLKNQNKRNAQRKFLKMAKLVVDGRLSIDKFNASYTAWKNHISHGNCYSLANAMDLKINDILKDVKMNDKQSHING